VVNKRILLILALIFIYFVCAAEAFAVEGAKVVGKFSLVSGNIKHSRSTDSGYTEYTPEDALRLDIEAGDKIATLNDSTCEILTNYGASVKMICNTQLEMYYYAIRVNDGGGWVAFNAHKNDKGKYVFKFDMPQVTLGVRGTVFGFFTSQDESYVQLTEGLIETKTPKDGKIKILNAGNILSAKKEESEVFKFEPGFDMIKYAEGKGNMNELKRGLKENKGIIDNPWKQIKK